MSLHAGEVGHDDVSDGRRESAAKQAGVDLEQLQLIQLCFGEHEFGVALDNVATDDVQERQQDGAGPDAVSQHNNDHQQGGLGVAFEFDSFLFVQEKLDHGVPLRSLCRDLETFAKFLDSSILRHVNMEVHDSFVKVSGHLVGMQDELRCVQQPVLAAVKKVEGALEKLAQLEEAVHSQLGDATEVELARLFDVSFLKLLLMLDLLSERVEALPTCMRSTAADAKRQQQLRHSDSFSLATMAMAAGSPHVCEALLDIAVTVQQWKALYQTLPRLSQRARECEEASELLREGTQLAHRVFSNAYLALHEAYLQDPREELKPALRVVMGLYRTAGEVREFCRMYRERILRPLLESVLSWRAATQARYSLGDTSNLLADLREQLETKVLCFVPLLWESFEGAVLPIPMIVWPAVCEAVVKKLVSLYDISVADAFQKRYVAAHELLALMVANCSSAEELQALMQSPDVALWRHKWNTDVYGTIRANELSKKIDDAIQAFCATPWEQLARQAPKQPEEHIVGDAGFRMELFTKLREALDWLFSPEVYIYILTPKFIREAAAAMRRVVQKLLEHAEAAQDAASMQDCLYAVMTACVDLEDLAAYVEGPFRMRLEKASQQPFPATSPLLQLLTQDTCRSAIVSLHRVVQNRLAEECLVGLQNIRSVRSAYSHMRKPFPTTPSWYVASTIEPLQRFYTAVRTLLPPATRHGMMVELVIEVASRFRTLAKETLVTAKKTEESWEKLRRRKETTNGGRGPEAEAVSGHGHPSSFSAAAAAAAAASVRPTQETASDRDKMTLQLYLDAKAFVREVETTLGLGAEAEKLAAVVALFKLLRRANWIMGEDIPEPPDIDEAGA
ncbi:putative conserved oligomeric golgi complex subunit [Trypanosoma conorhini]|uniref:Conserved oligomeric Golgi complex subunit 2 n=1 Tax=Trypanosoma conorhini TaxID=83891 RepID=A0A3R7LLL6_9TRYP|nr:putative conserved oligomeric golgi complex subunit [Trypanosoma conorhini]RNF27104.1 putative conserved oligomeric golgi complex subunit [Trypanosoma conorhini]